MIGCKWRSDTVQGHNAFALGGNFLGSLEGAVLGHLAVLKSFFVWIKFVYIEGLPHVVLGQG